MDGGVTINGDAWVRCAGAGIPPGEPAPSRVVLSFSLYLSHHFLIGFHLGKSHFNSLVLFWDVGHLNLTSIRLEIFSFFLKKKQSSIYGFSFFSFSEQRFSFW